MTHAVLLATKVETAVNEVLKQRAAENKNVGQYRTAAMLIRDLGLLAMAARGSRQETMTVSLETFALISSHYDYPAPLVDQSQSSDAPQAGAVPLGYEEV